MNKWLIISIAACIGVIIFFLILVSTKLSNVAALPIQVAGALLEAIVTAFITMTLLRGQSSADEVKEKNVEVFREKYKVFKQYIDEIWDIWKYEKIDMDDFEKLKTSFYQKIMLFLKKKKLDEISDCLCNIGKMVDKNQKEITSSDANIKNACPNRIKMKDEVFKIINILSDEIGLGGQIDSKKFEQINSILLPKYFLEKLLKKHNDLMKIDYLEKGYYSEDYDGKKYIWHKFTNEIFSGCYIAIGPFDFKQEDQFIGLWVEMGLPVERKYRENQGWLYGCKFIDNSSYPVTISKNIEEHMLMIDKRVKIYSVNLNEYLTSQNEKLDNKTVIEFLNSKFSAT